MAKPEAPGTLNQYQKRLCELRADPENRIYTKTKLAKLVGVSRPTLDSYLKRQDVQEYTKELIDFYTDDELSNIWKAHIREAKRGNMTAIKLFYEMKQMYVPPNQAIDFKMKGTEAVINIITNIPRPEGEDKKGE